MSYYISRGGQQYGPYSLAELQSHMAQGFIVQNDYARIETMQNWLPLSQLLTSGAAPAPAQPPYAQPVTPASGPMPPSMHWALVLVLSWVTCGIFAVVWNFVQAGFARKIDAASKATLLFALSLLVIPVAMIIVVSIGAAGGSSHTAAGLAMLLVLPAALLPIFANFSIRASMLRYYNSVEPVSLRLSGVMTFFFHMLYLQYHMSRIANWRRTGFLRP